LLQPLWACQKHKKRNFCACQKHEITTTSLSLPTLAKKKALAQVENTIDVTLAFENKA
jgi:hypothetical protein